MKFKDLKVGDMFTLSSTLPDTDQYVNMKVAPSIVIGHTTPFNVINLVTGGARTFHDDQDILKINSRKIHLA